jgi:hypothetical protein
MAWAIPASDIRQPVISGIAWAAEVGQYKGALVGQDSPALVGLNTSWSALHEVTNRIPIKKNTEVAFTVCFIFSSDSLSNKYIFGFSLALGFVHALMELK